MADRLLKIAEGFWNIRGSFKIGGVIDIGTQASLAKLASGGFALLDAYTLTGSVKEEILALTDGGKAIEAILNLHPFHTIHVRAIADMFPEAKLYGTKRHIEKAEDLPWQELRMEDPELHVQFAEDFIFSIPRGVDFISPNEKLHFSSVLAFHKASKVLHVDDTLTWLKFPFVGGLSFHLTLKDVLERRPGAVADFRAWAQELIELCEGTSYLCTAHTRPLPPASGEGFDLAEEVRGALKKVEKILVAHERKHG